MIQAIETHYNGYRFRSRLEARWAVFFDALGIEYQYEAQGYSFQDVFYTKVTCKDALPGEDYFVGKGYIRGGAYLPDFWLPRYNMFVEIKGDRLSDEDERKAIGLCESLNKEVLVCIGEIGPCFTGNHYMPGAGQSNLRSSMTWLECVCCHEVVLESSEYANKHPSACHDPCQCYGYAPGDYSTWDEMEVAKHPEADRRFQLTQRITSAYAIARSARFEHGQTPQVIERIEYRTVERDPVIWRDVDIIVRDYPGLPANRDYTQPWGEVLGVPVKLAVHLDDGGVPLCAPLDASKNGGFNLDKWKPRRADVLVSNICARCLKYSLARSKRRSRK